MSNEMLQKTIDLVSSLEVKNETQQIAKYELIEYTERLHKENQELKKQYCERTDCSGRIKDSKQYDSLVQRVDNQQKEFIEWLEDMLVSELDIFSVVRVCDVLSKYKELIGVKDE